MIDAPMKLALALEAGAKDESECGVMTSAAPYSSLGKCLFVDLRAQEVVISRWPEKK